jgi:hypothetical protein
MRHQKGFGVGLYMYGTHEAVLSLIPPARRRRLERRVAIDGFGHSARNPGSSRGEVALRSSPETREACLAVGQCGQLAVSMAMYTNGTSV